MWSNKGEGSNNIGVVVDVVDEDGENDGEDCENDDENDDGDLFIVGTPSQISIDQLVDFCSTSVHNYFYFFLSFVIFNPVQGGFQTGHFVLFCTPSRPLWLIRGCLWSSNAHVLIRGQNRVAVDELWEDGGNNHILLSLWLWGLLIMAHSTYCEDNAWHVVENAHKPPTNPAHKDILAEEKCTMMMRKNKKKHNSPRIARAKRQLSRHPTTTTTPTTYDRCPHYLLRSVFEVSFPPPSLPPPRSFLQRGKEKKIFCSCWAGGRNGVVVGFGTVFVKVGLFRVVNQGIACWYARVGRHFLLVGGTVKINHCSTITVGIINAVEEERRCGGCCWQDLLLSRVACCWEDWSWWVRDDGILKQSGGCQVNYLCKSRRRLLLRRCSLIQQWNRGFWFGELLFGGCGGGCARYYWCLWLLWVWG